MAFHLQLRSSFEPYRPYQVVVDLLFKDVNERKYTELLSCEFRSSWTGRQRLENG